MSYKVIRHQITGGVTTDTEVGTFSEVATARENARSLNAAALNNVSQDTWHTVAGPFASSSTQPSQPIPQASPTPTVFRELELKHNEIQSNKVRGRERSAKLFLLFLTLSIVGSSVYYLYFLSTGLAGGGFVLLSILMTAIFAGNTYSPLTSKSQAFEKIYEAIGKIDSSTTPPVRRHIHDLLESAIKKIESEDSGGDYLYKEPTALVEQMYGELRNRLLPSATRGDLRKDTLTLLAKVVTDPTLQGIQGLNTDLSGYTESIPPKGKSMRELGIGFVRSRYGQIVVTLGFSYALVFVISFFFALGFQQDYETFLRTNVGYVFAGGIAFTGGLLAFLKK